MRFRIDLRENPPLDYAPGLKFTGRRPYWVAPVKYGKAGWKISAKRLVGERGDGRDIERARACRELTIDMLDWYEGKQTRSTGHGTWKWLINRYRGDKFSPYQNIAAKTRRGYDGLISSWEAAIGRRQIADTDYERIMVWYGKILGPDRSRISMGHHMMTMLRTLTKYGRAIEAPGADRVKAILEEIRFTVPRPRQKFARREEIDLIVAKALERGRRGFAIGLRMQFDLAFRASDARGVWEPDMGAGGITYGGKRWSGGVTWEMIDRDVTVLEKMAHKTEKHMDRATRYDLTLTPVLRSMLLSVPLGERVGPVCISGKTGLPYSESRWSRLFVELRRECGLREDLWCMDARSGAMTEAQQLGATIEQGRDFAQHTNTQTTQRYFRGHDDSVSKVLKLRSRNL